MANDNLEIQDEETLELATAPEAESIEEQTEMNDSNSEETTQRPVLGHVIFDGEAADNALFKALISPEHRNLFRREVYVSIKDEEQNVEFLGRIVEGPFHTPHTADANSNTKKKSGSNAIPAYDVYGNIELLGQLLRSGRVAPTLTRPRPFSEISIFPPERLNKLLEIDGEMSIGSLMGYDEQQVEIRANAENKHFLPLNVGVFGTVGSGKSNTVQVLIEEASQAGWACVVIDVEGEYVQMNDAQTRPDLNRILRERYSIDPAGIDDFQVFVPSSGSSDADHATRFKVPIAELDISIVADILEFSEPEFRLYEMAVEASQRTPSQRRSSSDKQAQTSAHPYTLSSLVDVLFNSAFYIHLDDAEKDTANTLRNKLLYTLGRSGMLDWTSTEDTPYLDVNDLLAPGRVSIFDVSETDDRSRNIAIAHILESLFEKVTEITVGETIPETGLPRPKVLLVLEEVHTFVSRQSVKKMKSVLDSLQTISRRGRKRWLSLALVSQQPSHVPDELFELANTRFIHQLKSEANIEPVKQTTGGVHEALWSTVTALGAGQCLLMGRIFRNPLLVNIRPAKSKRLLTD